MFNADRYLKPNEFLNDLSVNLKKLINNNENDLSKEEKNTYDRFNKILQFNIDDNHFNDNKTTGHKNNDSWRKKRVDLSEKKCNESHQQKNESWRRKRDPRHE